MLALTHVPSPQIDQGQRTHVTRVPSDPDLAVRQHQDYGRMLQGRGVQVVTLDVNRQLPDAVFIEDTAVVLDEVAVLASMGAASRRAEPPAVEAVLRQYRTVERLDAPATLEGGDVLQVGRTLLVGVSSRTDAAGVRSLDAIVRRHGYRVAPVTVRGCLHLKTACTALPDHRLLVNPAWLDLAALDQFTWIPVPETEPWAANTLSVQGTVCLAAEHGETADLVRSRGFEVATVPLSEFLKAEGGMTCLSLLFQTPGPP